MRGIDQGFSFTLETPDRTYLLSAENGDDRTQWMNVIQKVIEKPLTPQDVTGEFRLVEQRLLEFRGFDVISFGISSGSTSYKETHS